ncbi:MmcQ/YjbR family DNA-binding protein [Mangrovimonas sp. AS39]|uniref:MmcQ/YjbR family DNA-binding protein n=1 Tax=Mangrovimonas futianensis TaxID=2895523 RepID=UPI001E5B3007|nr:MmcQ/YjbR family DNA-binding protein [Mangrovimonas futianensis]MCF1190957.1 MmcQ/YjbR family DNA-binding protein [Mangrovimonas futianensis]MCF1194653.1 MmcQ/YjbR family DNA-binding protein [Mangrovimonas futianensis]
MNIEDLRAYCLGKSQVIEAFPFDEHTLVFKVLGKIFAFVPLEKWEAGEPTISLKCDPDYALELRAQYSGIQGAFHLNKTHWNSVDLGNGEVSIALLKSLINHSYDLIVKSLPKKQQDLI